MKNVFVSYSSKNKVLAERLARDLNEAGLNVWIDFRRIHGGEAWREKIFEGIAWADALALILTPDSVNSEWVRREILMGRSQHKRIIPLMMVDCFDLLPQYEETRWLPDIQILNFQASYEQGFPHLLRALAVSDELADKVDPAQIENPFKGLEAFQETDADLFFGRGDLVQRLLGQLAAPAGPRFLAVVGASGTGKSSLVRAGLVPAIRAGDLPGSQDWPVVVFTPGERPLEALATRLLPLIGGDRLLPEIISILKEAPDRLHQTAEGILAQAPESARLVLVIDQFEEVFKAGDDADRANLIDLLHTAVTMAGGRVLVILTMRADFFDRLSAYPRLAELFGGDRLAIITELGPAELRQSIEQPAAKVGLVYDEGLPDRILEDVRQQPGSMPLLQYALKELFERRDGRQLTLAAYEAIGGVQRALAGHAEAIFSSLDAAQQDIMRRVLLRLVEVGPESITRRRVNQATLTLRDVPQDAVNAIIDRLTAPKTRLLIANRAITPGETEVAPPIYVEISHEAMIREWDRFSGWIAANRDELRYGSELLNEAQDWEAAGRSTDYLLIGSRLGQAEEWLKTADANDLQRAYIEASVAERDRQDEAERDRQRQELALKERALESERTARLAKENELIAQEHKLTAEQRARRFLRRLVIALVVFLAVAGVLAIVAWISRQQAVESREDEARARAIADTERDNALAEESRLLAARALDQLTIDPLAGVQMGIQALTPVDARPYVPEAEFALTRAMHAALERARLANSVTSLAQVAFDGERVAVGGTQLVVSDPALSAPEVWGAGSDGPIRGVNWGADGHLLSYDASTVTVWDAGTASAALTFEDDVTCAHWGSDGRIAVCSGPSLWLWNPMDETAEELYVFWGDLQGAAWSPDGQWITAWDQDPFDETSTLLWWEVSAGQERTEVLDDYVDSALWSPDSRFVLTIGADPDFAAHLWPVEAGEPPLALVGHAGPVDGARFLDDGRILTWSYDRTARLWSADGKPLRTFGTPLDPDDATGGDHVRGAVLSEDGTRLLVFLGSGIAQVWDTTAEDALATLNGHTAAVLAAAWQGDRIATASADNTVRIWDAVTGTQQTILFGHTDRVLAVRWLDAQRVLTVGADGNLRVWEVYDEAGVPWCEGEWDGVPLCHWGAQAFAGHTVPVESALWLDDANILSAGDDGARRWSLQAGRQPRVIANPVEGAQLRWNAAGTLILVFIPGQPAQMLDGETGRPLYDIPLAVRDAFWLGSRVLVSGPAGEAILLDGRTGAERAVLEGHTAPLRDARLSPDGTRILTAGSDGLLGIWDATSGEMIASFLADTAPDDDTVRFLFLSAAWLDNARVISMAMNGVVTLWDVAAGDAVWRYTTGTIHVGAIVRVSPAGDLLALVSDGIATVLSTTDGALVWQIDVHEVRDAQWSPGGTRLLTWGSELGLVAPAGTARVWDMPTRTEVLRLMDTGPIWAAAFNSAGTQVLTAGSSGHVLVWPAWPDQAAVGSLLDSAEACCVLAEAESMAE